MGFPAHFQHNVKGQHPDFQESHEAGISPAFCDVRERLEPSDLAATNGPYRSSKQLLVLRGQFRHATRDALRPLQPPNRREHRLSRITDPIPGVAWATTVHRGTALSESPEDGSIIK